MASVFRLFSGLIPSSLGAFCNPLVLNCCSDRDSDDCDRFRAFCAPKIPSLAKPVRWILDAVGDLSGLPFVVEPSCGTEVSMENDSLDGNGNGLPELLAAPAERGESPVDDGDISSSSALRTHTHTHQLIPTK